MGSKVETVLVSGAGGFIGTELVKQLLDTGYTVRATVRSIGGPQYAHLEALGQGLPGKLELWEADLTKEGSFDKAVDGAKFVFHTASPVEFGSGSSEEDQKNIVDVAVHGTTTVLKSVARVKSVKRVVLTSTVGAMSPSNNHIPGPGQAVYTHDSWNEYDTIKQPYYLSKVLAEKAAWELAKQSGIDLVTIHPSVVLGPLTSKRGGFSAEMLKKLLAGEDWAESCYMPVHIDVRDVALAHILAAEIPTAHGRYIVSHASTIAYREIAEALKALYPSHNIAEPKEEPVRPVFDTSKTEKELGLKLIPILRTFMDQARTTVQLGLA